MKVEIVESGQALDVGEGDILALKIQWQPNRGKLKGLVETAQQIHERTGAYVILLDESVEPEEWSRQRLRSYVHRILQTYQDVLDDEPTQVIHEFQNLLATEGRSLRALVANVLGRYQKQIEDEPEEVIERFQEMLTLEEEEK